MQLGDAVAIVLVLSLDPVTPAIALAGELAVVPTLGLSWSGVWRRTLLVVGSAVPAGAVAWWMTTGWQGLAVGLRVVAIGLPGVLVLATIDATELADALAQGLRLPTRFVLASLAAVRLVADLIEEWDEVSMARRARGLDSSGPLRKLTSLPAMAFVLIVLALRRAVVLAEAMEARGFAAAGQRTWARSSTFTGRDRLIVAEAIALSCLATGVSLALGTWHFVWR